MKLTIGGWMGPQIFPWILHKNDGDSKLILLGDDLNPV